MIALTRFIHRRAGRERFHSVLFYWLLAGCALVPLTLAAIIVLTAHQSKVVHGIALGFRQAMKKYKIDTPMREYINRLQIENQCCGATSVSDWFKVSWIDTSNAAPINRLANRRVTSGSITACDITVQSATFTDMTIAGLLTG